MKLITAFLTLAISLPALAAPKPKACPEGFDPNFTCKSLAGLEGQPSDKAMKKIFPALRICQKAEGENILAVITTPSQVLEKVTLDPRLGYGHYNFSFSHKGEEKHGSLTITVSRPPFPGQITVVGGEMVYYTCDR